jgi:cysteinyl-tRNA synthetase
MALDVLLGQAPAAAIRYLLAVPHYRSNIEVVLPDSLDEARTAFERIENFVVRAAETCGDAVGAPASAELATIRLPEAFVAAMDDDLGTPAAMAVVYDGVRAGNTALASGDKDAAASYALAVRAMSDVVGVDPLDPHWRTASGGSKGPADAVRTALDALIGAELDARSAARSARDFATADAIRGRLTAAGVAVEDTADGARWSLVAKER